MVDTDRDPPRFATTEDEAARRYSEFGARDPFPDIASALLNSADIEDYVSATGMIVPFKPDDIKPASYGVRLGGKCVYWDEDNNKHRFILSRDPAFFGLETREEIKLPKNSITFVSLAPTFRLPEYIALRFNLRIQHVYRGLLLGTGPLVDPGFRGKLSFPLHNLTNEEYTLRAEDEIIYAEFTKLSKWKAWDRGSPESTSGDREGKYSRFDSAKLLRQDLDDYLFHATAGNPVASSIPQEVRGIEKSASEAARRAEGARSLAEEVRSETRRQWDRTLIGAGVAGVLGLLGSIYAIEQVRVSADQISQTATNDAAETKVRLAQLSGRVEDEHKEQAEAQASTKKVSDDYQVHLDQIEQQMRMISATLATISGRNGTAAVDELRKEVDGVKRQLSEMRPTPARPQPK